MIARPAASLAGLRVLIVEDEMIIALEIESMLRALGCEVVGPVGTLKSALRLAHTEALDAAVLDVNLHGEKVFPVADELQARGIPFLFATGYGAWTMPEEWRAPCRLAKPFRCEELEKQMRSISGR
jgi:DNA-binding response OmpR family regulator